MAKKIKILPLDVDSGIHCEIKIKGHLEGYWSDWLGGLEITQDAQGNSVLIGIVPDQAALHGILTQIRDLGIMLLSLSTVAAGRDSGRRS